MIIAAADGSSLSNPGPAGWAWYIDDDRWAAGGWARGTNNMGELMAVLDLLNATADAKDDLTVLCDSQYVINCCTKWIPGWKRRGWRKADGKPVLNVELLKDLDDALRGREVTFEWVRGHAGHTMNEAADERARAAATAYRDGKPVNRGPGFRPGTPATVTRTVLPPEPDDTLFAAEPEEHPVVALQRSLLTDEVRSSPERLDALLHPKFLLTDARGKTSGKGRTMAGTGRPLGDTEFEEVAVEELAPFIALHRWRRRTADEVLTVASVWIRNGDSWRLRHEQQTTVS
ncbi:ribonuclease HI family protein [Nigerium massiliense]|uniref:ribonuclease HI family protein n=1 Tax=Nigerium massiliense TaxID=1522317 RepID=UPI00058B011C|nr:ribonuclease HI family protein [Nigerium massiliense]